MTDTVWMGHDKWWNGFYYPAHIVMLRCFCFAMNIHKFIQRESESENALSSSEDDLKKKEIGK
jgi:hypothetical protein